MIISFYQYFRSLYLKILSYQNSPGGNKPLYASTAQHLWWQHTAGAAKALGLEGVVGNLREGCEADFLVLDPHSTPLMARRTAQANNLEELLFAMIVLGDDRAVARTVTAKKPVKQP